jgi:hypothetical protein
MTFSPDGWHKDLSVLRVTNTTSGSLSLEQMDVVQGTFSTDSSVILYLSFDCLLGATIGSVQLDEAFEACVRQRLDLANEITPIGFQPKELEDIAWKMAKGREYQNAKCEYGSSDDDTEYFTVAIPGLRQDYVNMNVGIANGEMMFRR